MMLINLVYRFPVNLCPIDSLWPSACRLHWCWLEGHPAVKFRTKSPMNSQQLSLESCNSWETVQPVLAWTIHRWRLDAKCLVVYAFIILTKICESSKENLHLV